MSDCPKCLDIPGYKHHAHTCDLGAPDQPEMMDVPMIADTFPVVLYLGSEDDREELIQAMMEIHPNMRSKKL